MTASNGAGAAMAVSANDKPRSPAHRRNPRAVTRARMDRLARHMEDGGTVPDFAVVEGIDRTRAYQLWRHVCDGLGWQAS